jgi:hypothetical protein
MLYDTHMVFLICLSQAIIDMTGIRLLYVPYAVAYLGGGGALWPLCHGSPLWLMGKFVDGLEDRCKRGCPPPPVGRIWAEN